MELPPSSLATPKLVSGASTVFMTPSSSTGKPVYPRPNQVTPLPLSFPSPAPTPPPPTRLVRPAAPQREEVTDILGRLYLEGFPIPCEKILSYLAPSDIKSSLCVSQTWNQLITSSSKLMAKLHTHSHRIRPVSSTAPTTKLSRPALTSLTNSAAPREAPSMKKKSTLPPLSHPSLKYRPCPSCQSPAKELNRRRAECTKCSLDFCQDCFRQWHDGECSRGLRSPKRKERATEICGTKKSKKRLRRL